LLIGRGIPIEMANNRSIDPLPLHSVPTPEDMLFYYTSAGGTITEFGSFGEDPLQVEELKELREKEFAYDAPAYADVFSAVVNGDGSLLISAIQLYHQCTTNLIPQ
jgi:hypothetical protein